MSRVIVEKTVSASLEALGLDFVDLVKNAKNIAIVSSGSTLATQELIDAIRFHCRTPLFLLDPRAQAETIEASIPRGDGVRMPIRRPKPVVDADVVIVLASMIPDLRRRTELSIEQYLFKTWLVLERSPSHFLHAHDPWLEGDLRDVILADLYAQRPITLSIIDGAATSGIALASFDAVAADAVCIHMNGVIPEDVGYLRMLAQQGLGVCTLSKIDVPLGMISR
ncbi:MAG: hypothetical protein WCT28_04095 [Patescibacteria group bacterium]|jgi:hypothetical protein